MNKLIKCSCFLMAMLGLPILADDPYIYKLENSELFASADFVAVVSVRSGKYADFKYDINADVELILKGKCIDKIKIISDYPFFEAPKSLGETYLIYAKNGEDGKFKLVHSEQSVVSVLQYDLEDVASLSGLVESKGKRFAEYYQSGGKLWLAVCKNSTDANVCEALISSARFAFSHK